MGVSGPFIGGACGATSHHLRALPPSQSHQVVLLASGRHPSMGESVPELVEMEPFESGPDGRSGHYDHGRKPTDIETGPQPISLGIKL